MTVRLNGTNDNNYTVNYIGKNDNIVEWMVPYRDIEKMASAGDLETYYNGNKNLYNSFITKKKDISLAHVLHSSLFMRTDI